MSAVRKDAEIAQKEAAVAEKRADEDVSRAQLSHKLEEARQALACPLVVRLWRVWGTARAAAR